MLQMVYKQRGTYGDDTHEDVRSLKLRFFTPREIANLMCFPPEFSEYYYLPLLWPGNLISPVCLVCVCVYLGLWDLRCAHPQRYRTTLCTTHLRCVPWFTRGIYACEKWRSPRTFFIFLAVHKEHAQTDTFCQNNMGRQVCYICVNNLCMEKVTEEIPWWLL